VNPTFLIVHNITKINLKLSPINIYLSD